MNFYTGSTAITALLSFSLGIFVYLFNRSRLLNKKWLYLSLSIAIWCFGYFLTLTEYFNHEVTLIFSRISHASGAYIPVLFFDFVTVLLNTKNENKKLLRYGYLLSAAMFICCFTPLVVKDVISKLNIKYYPEWGVLYPLYALIYYVFAIYGNILLYKAIKRSSEERKNQLKYFFVGTIFGFAGGISLFFLILNIKIPPFASILIGIYPIVTSYAIVRHKLMDIKVVIKKTLVFAGLLVSAFAILVLPTLLIQEYLFSGSIRKMLASISSMNIYYSLTGLINGMAGTALGLFVYFKNKKAALNRTYALFALSISIWSYFYIFWPLTDNKLIALYSFRLAHVGADFIPICYFHFILVLLNRIHEKKQRLILNIGYMLSFIFLPFLFTSLIFKDMVPKLTLRLWAEPGILYPIFLLNFLFYGAYSLWLVYVESRRRDIISTRKTQLKYVLISSIIAYVGGSTNFAVFYNIPILPVWNIGVALYVAIMAYAILRHQLMDIKVIIRKTIIFTGLLTFVFIVLILSALLIQEYFVSGAGSSGRVLGLAISGIVIIFSMRKIENLIVNLTDKYLFQKKYDYKELLRTFTTEVLTVLDLNKLVNLTVDKLMDIVRLNSCAVLLLNKEKKRLNIIAHKNINGSTEVLLNQDNVVFLEGVKNYYLAKEIIAKEIIVPESIQEIINKLDAELVIPMMLHDEAMGVLSLGKKKSDEGYTQDDLDILLPLARTLAIAISNAELFDELGKTQAEAAQKEKMAVIGTLAAGMAHEIRNPITTIKIFSEFLKEKKDDPEFIKKFERIVPGEVDKINHMITNLLEFSKPADYKSMEGVDIKDALKDVLDILGNEMALNDIFLEENISRISPIYGNKRYVQEVLFNLIQNAIHAIGRKGKIAIAARDDGNSVSIRIRDTGCGMTSENIKHVFEPFFTTKLNEKGVGLGLYVIKQLMLRMGGNISVESEVGKGATFSLNFKKFNE